MKRLNLSLVIIFFLNNIIAQTYVNFPMDNASWYRKITNPWPPPSESINREYLDGFITYDSLNYAQAWSENITTHEIQYRGGIREDSAQRKIYFHNGYFEQLLYDFSRTKGDTIFFNTIGEFGDYYYKIIDTSTIIINGAKRNFYNLISSYNKEDSWIEGIGSVYRDGLLSALFPDICTCSAQSNFGCFRNDTIVYINDNVCSGDCPCISWLVNIKETELKKFNALIYPNPAQNDIFIDFSMNENIGNEVFVEIDNIIGQKMISGMHKIYDIEKVNIEKLNNGIYIIKIKNNDNALNEKIMIIR